MSDKGYVLSNADEGERRRLEAIEAAYDPRTTARLSRLGVVPGARVLLLGAGGGSVARWAAEEVGADGRVVATDVDPRFLEPLADKYPQLDVVRNDAVNEELPAGPYDVAHARLLLGHLPQREQVLRKMVEGLVPGGAVLVEDFDWGSYGPALPNEAAEKAIGAVSDFLRAVGFDTAFGRRLPTLMRSIGLRDVDAEGIVLSLRGATFPLEPMYRQTFDRLLPTLIEQGHMTAGEAEALHARFDDPEHDMLTQTLMSVWGHRPSSENDH
ncbi:class I SAM-dependent methyltransferase [Actinomadura rudentiformis]|uniref:Methyltransferase domain-containing protein n=1 Tax=Actinomadura rudentiformis TaxID=359158 RepID=A0A6H9YL04_9ACTN|nr:methyltransferase domain-containing protein [Actinomadura rudentiformis]KAB2342452.1 methyltransferase domain-containing protein [Actinomadura rudentiformis]